jgi:hypothetical protein
VILLAQLSDIHLTDEKNVVLERGPAIASALASLSSEVDSYFLVCTGDVAFSGTAKQYSFANTLFTDIATHLKQRAPDAALHWVFIPGNHDCNFETESETRPVLLEGVASRYQTLSGASKLPQECLAVQNSFYKFVEAFNASPLLPRDRRLYHEESVNVGNKRILFRCINTAWMSTIHEKQGSLFFPLPALDATDFRAFDLVVSLLHHPYNWIAADNARDLRATLERTSDVILTGHEHDGVFYAKSLSKGEVIHYIEGSVLQERNNALSGFNVLLLDLAAGAQSVVEFHWTGSLYAHREAATRMPFIRNSFLTQQRFEANTDFHEWLADPGTKFSHRYKGSVTFSDLFIYPDLQKTSLKAQLEGKAQYRTPVPSDTVANEIFLQSHALIAGPERSGKTSLAKALYREAQRRTGEVPLYLGGDAIAAS